MDKSTKLRRISDNRIFTVIAISQDGQWIKTEDDDRGWCPILNYTKDLKVETK